MRGRSFGSLLVTIVVAAIAGGAVGTAVFLVLEWSSPATIELAPVTPADIFVQIDGAVAEPGLVTLPAGARLADAIEAAGGFTDDADVTRLNLAGRLADGDHITVPSMVAPHTPGGTPQPAPGSGLININTAGLEELQQLPGIGPVIAQRIIDFREFYGPFTSVDQLDEVTGISPAMIDDLRPLVTTGG